MVELLEHGRIWLNYGELTCSIICYVTCVTLINSYVTFQCSSSHVNGNILDVLHYDIHQTSCSTVTTIKGYFTL